MSAHVHLHFPDGFENHAQRLVDQVNQDEYLSWVTGLDETEIADCTATLLTVVTVSDPVGTMDEPPCTGCGHAWKQHTPAGCIGGWCTCAWLYQPTGRRVVEVPDAVLSGDGRVQEELSTPAPGDGISGGEAG